MNETELFLEMLRTTRLQCLATVKGIDNILALAEQPTTPRPTLEHDDCPHPPHQRVPTPAMGFPGRFRCLACGGEVDNGKKEGKANESAVTLRPEIVSK